MSEEFMQEFKRLKRTYDQVMKQSIRCNGAFINNVRIHQEEEERRRQEQEKQRAKEEQHAALRVGDGIKAIKGSLNGTIGINISRIDVGKGVTRFSVLSLRSPTGSYLQNASNFVPFEVDAETRDLILQKQSDASRRITTQTASLHSAQPAKASSAPQPPISLPIPMPIPMPADDAQLSKADDLPMPNDDDPLIKASNGARNYADMHAISLANVKKMMDTCKISYNHMLGISKSDVETYHCLMAPPKRH